MEPRKPRHSLNLEDEALIERVLGGDEAAFAELYDAHARHVLGVCIMVLWDIPLAEEVRQDVFLRVRDKLDQFRGESAFGTWLYRVAYNMAVDAGRAKSRKVRAGVEERLEEEAMSAEEAAEASEAAPDEYVDPKEAASLEAAKAAVRRQAVVRRLSVLLGQIPPKHMEILLLRDADGMAYDEIAAKLDIPIGTVMSRLFWARKYTKNLLEGGAPRGRGVAKERVEPEKPTGPKTTATGKRVVLRKRQPG